MREFIITLNVNMIWLEKPTFSRCGLGLSSWENLKGEDFFTTTPSLILNRFKILQILREKCPNMELFLVRIFPHSDWIRRDTSYLSVFSPNAGKYGPEITSYLDTFYGVKLQTMIFNDLNT